MDIIAEKKKTNVVTYKNGYLRELIEEVNVL